MTYPLIGNYGINSLDQESRSPHVRGFVIEELTEVPSNWRSEMSLDEYLRKWNVPGAKGIDTRALTRHLRTRGAMKACLTTEEISPEEATQRAIEGKGVIGMDYVREVSTEKIYRWDPGGQTQRAMVESDSRRTKAANERSTHPISYRRVRLRHQAKHSAASSSERLRGDCCPCQHNCRRSAGIRIQTGFFSPTALAIQRRFAYAHKTVHNLMGQKANLRDLSRSSDSRIRVRRIDIQIEVRPSRRQPAGKRFTQRQSGHHCAKSRIRGRR